METTGVIAPVPGNESKSLLHDFHVLRDAKPPSQTALLASADDDLIKSIVDCAIMTLNGNHKRTIDEKSKLSKYKNRLCVLIDSKISFRNKRKLLIQKGVLKKFE